jgi:predicted Zn-dependent protease
VKPWRHAVLPLAGLLLAAGTGAAPPSPLTEPQRLAAIYDLILDARFDDARKETARVCPAAPSVGCQMLDLTALWWRIQLDEESTALDAEFSRRADAVIAAAEAWTSREPRRAESWFYLGAAYGARVQWRVLRSERLAAARDGKRIKDALERAIELDPQLYDARFGIGLYKYYADLAPAAAKLLRFLLLLPGGDRQEGLNDMIIARDRGALLRGEADYQLHWIYFWYEEEPEKGLALLERLHTRYDGNPLFAQRIAEVQVTYFHDTMASLATWQSLLDAALTRRVNMAPLAAARARLGAAEQLDAIYETDRAIDVVSGIVASRASAPYAALSRAYLMLAQFQDRLGHRQEAVANYTAALNAIPPRDLFGVGVKARAGLRRAPDPRACEAYRLSLDGWRAFERGALTEAERALDRSLRLVPDDPVAQFRRGRVHVARREYPAARLAFAQAIAARPLTPPVYVALAHVGRAQVLESERDWTGAIDAYRSASRVFGADIRTRTLAQQAIARLQITIAPTLPPH